MPGEQIFLSLGVFWLASHLLRLGTETIGSNIYDSIDVRRQTAATKSKNRRPFITVVIYARNDASHIEDCLKNIAPGRLRNWEIIVIDDHSQDDTKRLVRRFMKDNPKRPIKLYAPRKHKGYRQSVSDAVKVHAKGEVIATLMASDKVHADYLINIADRFRTRDVDALVPRLEVAPYPNFLNLYARFRNLLGQRTRKVAGLLSRSGDVLIERTVFRAGLKRSEHMIYADDVIIHISRQGNLRHLSDHPAIQADRSTLKRPLAAWHRLTDIMEPIVITYFIFTAIRYDDYRLLGLSWLILSLSLLLAIWPRRRIGLGKKIGETLYVPMLFVLFYLISIIRLLLLMNGRKLYGLGRKSDVDQAQPSLQSV